MRWFLVLTSLGLIVCVAGVFLLMRPDPKASRPATSPFFSDEQVLLRQVPGDGPTPKFAGTPVYDACSVITIDSLNRLGVEIRTEDGLSVARLDLGDMVEIRLWKAGLLVVVAFQTERPGPYGPFDKAAFASKLEPIVKASLLRGPTAPVRHVYTSLFDKVKHPCEIANTEAFMKAFPSRSAKAALAKPKPPAGQRRDELMPAAQVIAAAGVSR